MNKTILLATVCVALVITAFVIKPKNDIVGHWAIKFTPEIKILLDFDKDGTVKVGVPAENFTVMGKYKVKGDVLSVADSTCGKEYWGNYKIKFFTEDSVYSTIVTDSCTARSSALNKATLVREK